MMDNFLAKPLPYRVLVTRFDREMMEWLKEHRVNQWTLHETIKPDEVDYEGSVVMFESLVEAVEFKLRFDGLDPPEKLRVPVEKIVR